MIGMQGDGLGCTTASYYIPSAFIQEVCGSLCENEMDVYQVLPASGNGDYTLLQRNFMVIVKLLWHG